MSKALELKKVVVSEVAEKLKNSQSTVLADYRGLTAKESDKLRKLLRDENIEFKILKNTLTLRASQEAGLDLGEHLVGPSAFAFSADDAIAPARVLNNFAKEHKKLKLKAGVIEGKVINGDEVKALAELPSKEGLISMLLSVLQAPMRNFALGVKAVAEKKEQEAS